MQILKSKDDFATLTDNKIIGAENIELHNSSIRFNGKGNILFCEENVRLYNSQIKFLGDDCIIYLSSNKHCYYLDVSAYKNSVFYIGKNNFINGAIHAVLSEQKNVFIGDDGLFSFDIWIRTADPHLVYSAKSKKRVNPSKSVFIGDHVWIGQSVFILKGTHIGSGSIVGAAAVCSGKELASNSSFGGNPVKQIGEDVFWTSDCVHTWDDEMTKEHETYYGDEYIYSADRRENISFSEIDRALGKDNLKKKLKYLQKLSENRDKNRFYIG